MNNDKMDKIREIITEAGFPNIGELSIPEIEYHKELRDMCEMNSCGRYGTSWNCPPVIGSLEELSDECKSHSDGFIFSFVSELEDSFDFEGMTEAGKELCRKLCKIQETITDNNELDSYKLYGSGACFSCEKCTYPDNPCRFPEMCFVPIEACGIYVTEVAKNSGLKYNNGPNTVTFFGMLLYS